MKTKLMLITLVLLFALSGCAEPQPAALTAEQVDAVTENILLAIDSGDYQKFTQDFSAEMLAAFPPDQFESMHTLLQESSGDFVSLGKMTLVNQNGYAVYIYQSEYEQEKVIVKIVFAIDGTQVDGLFFDSTNLRAASK